MLYANYISVKLKNKILKKRKHDVIKRLDQFCQNVLLFSLSCNHWVDVIFYTSPNVQLRCITRWNTNTEVLKRHATFKMFLGLIDFFFLRKQI